nr:hypothetical protein CFP56_56264 [Quercus suber]
MDSWDAMIAKEASGTRDEPVEILEQSEMVTTLQTDGTNMEKATEDLPCLSHCVIDLGFIGPSFTWSNRREGIASIRERLYQCLCDQGWQTIFPKAGVRHLCNFNSNHNPIILDTNLEIEMGSQPFQFEAMWTKEEKSKMVVENAWQTRVEGSGGFRLAKKLLVTSSELVRWNKNSFRNTKEKINGLPNKLLKIQQAAPTKENLNLEASQNLELDEWLAREDLRLRQNSSEL